MPCSGDGVTGHWTGSNLSHYKSSCYDNGQVQLWVTIYCHASVTDRFKPDSPFIDMWRTGSNSSHHLMPCYGDKQIQAWQVSWLVRWWPLANIETDLHSCQKLPTAEYFSIWKKHKHLLGPTRTVLIRLFFTPKSLWLLKDVVVIFCAQLWFCLNSCSHLQELNVEPASVAARYEESVPGDPARLTRPIIQLHRPPRLHRQVPQTGAKQLRLLGER